MFDKDTTRYYKAMDFFYFPYKVVFNKTPKTNKPSQGTLPIRVANFLS